jgi:hypothetical protein
MIALDKYQVRKAERVMLGDTPEGEYQENTGLVVDSCSE